MLSKVLSFVLGYGVLGSLCAAPPNILFIMTDDHAAQALSIYGSQRNQTPHLDRIGKEGVVFENCFVTNSICTPSRATLLTGKYSHKNGTPVFNRFNGDQPVVSRMLQQAGYHTGMMGKWHLGSDPTGFDKWQIFPGQGQYENPVLYSEKEIHRYPGKYATDVVTDLCIDFLKTRPKDKPFLLFCHHKAPHREWTPDPKNKALFAGKNFVEPSTLFDDYASRGDGLKNNKQTTAKDLTNRDLKLKPPTDVTGTELQKWNQQRPTEITVDGKLLKGEDLARYKYQRYMQDYLACVQGVDDNVGRLLDFLKAEGLEQNTVVFYTSDNGFFLGEHGLYDKRFMYEESLRIPFLVRWPAELKPGLRTKDFAVNVDFAPTFLELAGQPVPKDMQGRSLLPVLRGKTPADWPTSMYYRYYHDPGHHNTAAHLGVRTHTHKLIHYWRLDQWEMYDLEKDPQELNNIYAKEDQQEQVAKLKAEIARLKAHYDDKEEYATNEDMPKDGVDAGIQKREQMLQEAK